MSHTCHARGCEVPVKPELLMCYRHWSAVPKDIQRAVWQYYRPGQCDDKRLSREWFVAADAAIGYVALLEHHSCAKAEAKALIAYGYEEKLVDAFTTKKHRAAARKVIDDLKREMGVKDGHEK